MRQELLRELLMILISNGMDDTDINIIKDNFIIAMDRYEITPRETQIALLQEDRNEMLIKKFLAAKKTRGCTNRTIKYYNGQIRFILNTINKTVDDITADDINLYTAQRLVRDKVTKTSVGNEQRVISSFFGWLFREEYIKHDPMTKVDRMKNVKSKKKALTEMEVERIRDACKNNKDKAVIELLLSTGCRVSELVNIKT
jgi:site-specific recombinase XerD